MQKQLKNGNFVSKLELLLHNPEYQEIIAWDHSQKFIDILDPQRMQQEITPQFFRHSKFESFVRQLNLYGFRKIKNQGRLRFTHPLLLDGLPLARIATSKLNKTERRTRETGFTLEQPRQQAVADSKDHIPRNSLTVKIEADSAEEKVERRAPQGDEGRVPAAGPVGNEGYMMMQRDYWNWWAMMSSMVPADPYWPMMGMPPPSCPLFK